MADIPKQETNQKTWPDREEDILRFWQEKKIFARTLAQTASGRPYIFYDGPPFATGLPHYGHLLAGTIKDVIPRFQTMKGCSVRRRWGWDCHGLPIENLVEKELGLEHKKDIVNYGIDKFNDYARNIVLRYADEWKKIVPRLGRFVDLEDDYRTMDTTYTETIWWIFKQLFDRGLIYEGYKSMHLCPRCETTLSNFEVSQAYQEVTDISVMVKFALLAEPETYLIAWTTTPWTLPANVALAVNPEIIYLKLSVVLDDKLENWFLAEDRLAAVLASRGITTEQIKILAKVKGQELVGKKYQPIFTVYADDPDLVNRQHGWQVYPADYVSTEEGTGIVHLAPAFGEDDLLLGQKYELPFIQHVATDGTIKPELTELAGLSVKPKDQPQATDIEILKYLTKHNYLLAKEKIKHSYPHCWRCQTPLLNYATTSWFVKVSDLKNRLVAINQEINWQPVPIGTGRFGNWLENARDWAISRSRFWGAPLPVWRCDQCQGVKVFGSLADLAKELPVSDNQYYLLRHGQTAVNVRDEVSAQVTDEVELTEAGRQEIISAGELLAQEKIDFIYASDFVRTRQSAELVAEKLGLAKEKIIYDARLREYQAGQWQGQTWTAWAESFSSDRDRYQTIAPGGESPAQLKQRVSEFIFSLSAKHQGKNILLVSHGLTLFFIEAVLAGRDDRTIAGQKNWGGDLATGQWRRRQFISWPRNQQGDLDLHRPFIDKIKLSCVCGGQMSRVPDVFDCWFESGAMPYAQDHYPFADASPCQPDRGIGFPADFIAEGLDQTRGWFYSLLVLGTALFDRSPYRQVVVNGLILAEDGKKMSKSLNNYPDPMAIVGRYGADPLRFYLLASGAVRAEDLCFSEKGIAEISRKIFSRLTNVLSFYQTYCSGEVAELQTTNLSVLDSWLIGRSRQLIEGVDQDLATYELDKACRKIDEFIDDLSNWYLRRSRDVLRSASVSGDTTSSRLLAFILLSLAKVMAPIAPFFAEYLYQAIPSADKQDSVHLESWPDTKAWPELDEEIMTKMNRVRQLASRGLEARASAGIKTRQVLSQLLINDQDIATNSDWSTLLADELNVKEIVFDDKQDCYLDLTLTAELQAEGELRELARRIQEGRKTAGYHPTERLWLELYSPDDASQFFDQYQTSLLNLLKVDRVVWSDKLSAESVGVSIVDDLTKKFFFRLKRTGEK